MKLLRVTAAVFVGLLICTNLPSAPGFPSAQAQAQKAPSSKKKVPAAKGAPAAAPERVPFTPEDQQAAAIPDIPDARAWGDSATEFARLLPQAAGPWLAISGGGSDGAFGGGVLTGWTESGSRPEFTAVSGVSIGALIAPLAFLGPRYDDEIRKNFTTITAADIFEDRMLRDGLFDDWPLRRQIEQRVTPKLLAEIAAEHARGRRLYVATTNLDAGRRVVWNMGAIAARADEKALKLFRDVLLASSSIPGFFSPVPIEVEANGKKFNELHGDGTLTAPFFVVPEAMLSAGSTLRPPISELYLIVNSKLVPEFSLTDRTIAGVLGRSIAVALTAALRSEIMLVYAGAQRKGIAVRVAHVHASFNFPSRGAFDGKYMQALYELGVTAAKQGTAFQDGLVDLSMRGIGKAQ
ncbi:MAG TPA: patatin-like phospholipase family protein [Xanthobacteraceae bacterium]